MLSSPVRLEGLPSLSQGQTENAALGLLIQAVVPNVHLALGRLRLPLPTTSLVTAFPLRVALCSLPVTPLVLGRPHQPCLPGSQNSKAIPDIMFLAAPCDTGSESVLPSVTFLQGATPLQPSARVSRSPSLPVGTSGTWHLAQRLAHSTLNICRKCGATSPIDRVCRE